MSKERPLKFVHRLRSYFCFAIFFILLSLSSRAEPTPPTSVKIGNFLRGAPCGIAWIIHDNAAFVLDTGGPYVAGTAAPDDSYHAYRFVRDGANLLFEWGRVGNNIVGKISTDKEIELELNFSSGWPGWTSQFTAAPDGLLGTADSDGGKINWTLRTSPAPKDISGKITLGIKPSMPALIVAGLDPLQGFESVDDLLKKAREKYASLRPQALGDHGDFIAAITDNMNNSRLYSNDNHLLAHSVSRSWAEDANGFPYFCWDSFLTANLASLEDPQVAQDTVRAMLSYQSPAGLVPNFAHWRGNISGNRSQPPLASLCVWKMHQRRPNDLEFLGEIYPKLVLWHDWWPQHRNGKKDGLLEWGSGSNDFAGALYETGWDDTPHYDGAQMRGDSMNAYSIDLCSMWSMDASYLALIADFLKKPDEAAHFRDEARAMNEKINTRLWNSSLNNYCSRFWDDVGLELPVDSKFFGSGFAAQYFTDANLQNPAVTHQDSAVDFDWKGKSPIEGIADKNWSARWKGNFTPPATGTYRFKAAADDGVRVWVDNKAVIDDWSKHSARDVTGDVDLTEGKSVPVVVEYFQNDFGSELHLSVNRPAPKDAQGAFLTRLTPMNFYPLSCGAPDARRGELVMASLTDPKKFWGQYLLPTLAYDDPDYHQQQYWRGNVWGPPNYIVWQGIKKYGTPQQITEFADRSIDLFMKEWLTRRVCGENYLSTTGEQGRDPHYTWGALLCLIGLESIVDVDDSGRVVLNGAQTKTMTLKNIPLLGRVYDVKTSPGTADLIQDGKVILSAKGNMVRADLRQAIDVKLK